MTNRRQFLQMAGIVPAALAQSLRADSGWRTFEITTRVTVLKPSGPTRIWAPAALLTQTAYQRTLSNTFLCEGGTARKVESRPESLSMIVAEFADGVKPVLTVNSRVATRDWSVDLSAPGGAKKVSSEELKYCLRSTKLLPTDGIVRDTALEITKGKTSDLAKARAIYEWIVENTHREPKTRGCGLGNIKYMLESRDLGGKCADLNALFVGLARSIGLPARDVYGIRVAKSQLGYKSLGAASEIITKSQHCRAEVHLGDYGWVAVDPADVRKVMLEEPDERMVAKARARLFGSWEMNWVAYNFAHDVALPGSAGPPVGFLMYPQAETAEGRLDCLDPDTFRYEISAREA
ncbi:MAG TPA: transglutaminase-like domain-containing protein [Candidatus Sulfopaludibacter sp.]|jgi:transglutaminase-like putative cysteine protease|nr:transglutaminase-like domain-containing protein [Candidatus Sulfopaludibacter sp.]